MMSYYTREDEIVWITDLKELDLPFNSNRSQIPFLFSRYEVMDHTCDKCWKKTLSSRKADEWVTKKLATKKHANCNIEVIENNIVSELDVDLSNVLGTEANGMLWKNNYYNVPTEAGVPINPVLKKHLLTLKANISMIVEITEIEMDRNIITRNDEPMRLTVVGIKDVSGNVSKLTLFNAELADDFEVGTRLQLVDAQVNMRKTKNGDEYPDGLNIPRWGTLNIFSGDMPKAKQIENEGENGTPVYDGTGVKVRCEQEHCSKTALGTDDTQFFCTKCDKELCSICIFEHKSDYSISGLTCDNEICRGSRGDNQ